MSTCTSTTTAGGSTTNTTIPYVIPDATQQQAATNCEAFEIYAQANSQVHSCKLYSILETSGLKKNRVEF